MVLVYAFRTRLLHFVLPDTDSGEDRKKRGRTDKRYYKLCPIAGCKSKPQKKLSQHLDYKHPELKGRKTEFLRMARRVPRKATPVALRKGQPTLFELVSKSDDCRSEGVEDSTVAEGSDVHEGEPKVAEGTRHFPRYNMKHPTLIQFERYLTGVDGGCRNTKTASEMAVDVSKFLLYACGSSSPSPSWDRLTDRDQLLGFLDKLKRASVGPEGQLTKLDAICNALNFLKVVILNGDSASPLYSRASHTLEIIRGWKGTLRKDKRRLRKRRLQELSCQSLSLSEVSALLECKKVWIDFDSVCTRASRQEVLPVSALDGCSIAVAASILYKNWQRPGAVANATLQEFRECKLVQKDETTPLYVVSVREHKTALEGYAKLVLDGTDHCRIIQYKATVRKLQDSDGKSPQLFLLSGGRPLTHLSSRIQSFGKRYNLNLPTAAKVRKIGATAVAQNLGNTPEAHLVTRQLAHSSQTECQYYQAIIGDKHAAQAFQSMGRLCKEAAAGGTVSKPLASPRTPSQRKGFTTAESETVSDYFEGNVVEGKTPSLTECKEFLRLHPINRTPECSRQG